VFSNLKIILKLKNLVLILIVFKIFKNWAIFILYQYTKQLYNLID
jgi:hypothetical protein